MIFEKTSRTLGSAAVAIVLYALMAPAASAQEMDLRLDESIRWYTGVAGQIDNDRARELLLEVTQNAQDEDALALMWLARSFSRGRMGLPFDQERADNVAEAVLPRLRVLADRGIREAQFLLGSANDEGIGMPENAGRAIMWFERAASRGHVLAAHNMGNAYASGRGVTQNDSLAVHWWRLAAVQGDALAQFRMGERRENGMGIEPDLEEAIWWYRRAAGRGHGGALEALTRLGVTLEAEGN